MKTARRSRSKKGFTLIEVVISVIIVTGVSVGFLVMFSTAYAGTYAMGGRTRAVNEAQSLIEAYYENPLVTDTTWIPIAAGNPMGDDLPTLYPGYTHFYRVWSDTYLGETIQYITVRVFFDNNMQHVELTSMLS